jgi:3-oxoacyl-[acyl-carrier protein] reductase
MEIGLVDKVVIITGAGKGMGPAITNAFCKEGSFVAVLGRDLSALENLREDNPEYAERISIFSCDVTDAAQCDAAVAAVVAAHGQVDVLVNVAGGTGRLACRLGKPRPRRSTRSCGSTWRAAFT